MFEPPDGLAALQAAFGGAIATPLVIGRAGGEALTRIQVERYPRLALDGVTGHGGRSGPERLSTYNQQYWFRLLSVMQQEYPLLRHLLGVTEFNRMATAYLDAHPSRSPLLRHLSDALGDFLGGEHPWSRPELRQCAALEHAFIHSFDAPALPPLDPAALSPAESAGLLGAPLRLQPHLVLYREDWDLVRWRRRVRGDDDDAIRVQLSEASGWWVVHRGQGWPEAEPLDAERYRLLARLAAGDSLQAACDGLAASLPPEALARVAGNIQSWFARWVSLGWFVHQTGG